MFYLIETEYIGPDDRDSEGHTIGDTQHTMEIRNCPGRTNQSHEERTDGWLGATNDYSATAHGEYETIEAARLAAHAAGFPAACVSPVDELDDDVVECWISEAAARDQLDAADWFDELGRDGTRQAYGITAATTDEELDALAERAVVDARADNTELHGTLDLLLELRDELITLDN